MARDSALNNWFQQVYAERHSMAADLSRLPPGAVDVRPQDGLEKAQRRRAGAADPTTRSRRVRSASNSYAEHDVRLALARPSRALPDTAYGTYRFNIGGRHPELVDIGAIRPNA